MVTVVSRPIEVLLRIFPALLFVVCAGCGRSPYPPAVASVSTLIDSLSSCAWADPADLDNDPYSTPYSEWAGTLKSSLRPSKAYRLGGIVRFFGNPYYQRLAYGMHERAEELGVYIDLQAGASESDQEGQKSLMDEMIRKGYDAILICPQTDTNLSTAVRKAKNQKIVVVDVDGANDTGANGRVGPNQFESGVRVARYFTAKLEGGGKVAVIADQYVDYGATERTLGFVRMLKRPSFQIVVQTPCARDLQIALLRASQILAEHPDLVGIYCSSDIMALGAVQAVKEAGKIGEVIVVGRDGIEQAIESIQAGGMTATVDSMPVETGRIAVEVAVRILEGERVPAVVVTPQRLVTKENAAGVLEEYRRLK